MIKNYLLFLASVILISCGGGGGDSGPKSISSPTISLAGPTAISTPSGGSTPASVGCTGSTWETCIKITANVSDPQNRITTAQWQNLNTIGGVCYPVTVSTNTMSVPLKCTRNGYSCTYSYDVKWWTGTKYQYIQPFHTVTVQPVSCASGSAIDGYIQEATVFADLNKNLIQDTDEPFTTTNIQGQFYFNSPISDDVLLVMKGGIDSFTGITLPENYMLIGLSSNTEKRVISPISTLSYFLPDTYNINEMLGLSLFDAFLDDPVIQIANEEASKVLKTNMQISILLESISKITNESDYFKIYSTIAESFSTSTINLTFLTSPDLISQSIHHLTQDAGFDSSNIDIVSENLSNFLNAMNINEESNSHLVLFEQGMTTFPIDLANQVRGEEVSFQHYLITK